MKKVKVLHMLGAVVGLNFKGSVGLARVELSEPDLKRLREVVADGECKSLLIEVPLGTTAVDFDHTCEQSGLKEG